MFGGCSVLDFCGQEWGWVRTGPGRSGWKVAVGCSACFWNSGQRIVIGNESDCRALSATFACYDTATCLLTVAPRQSSGQPIRVALQAAYTSGAVEGATRSRLRPRPRLRPRSNRSTRSPGPGRTRSPNGGSHTIFILLSLCFDLYSASVRYPFRSLIFCRRSD